MLSVPHGGGAGCVGSRRIARPDFLGAAVLWSAERSQQADDGNLAVAEMVDALKENAGRWRAFKDARGPWLGISEVWMNAQYTQTIDSAMAWTSDMSRRASIGDLDEEELKGVLRRNAKLWKLFGEARTGTPPEKEGD